MATHESKNLANSIDITDIFHQQKRKKYEIEIRKYGCDPKRPAFFYCAVKQLTISFFWVT